MKILYLTFDDLSAPYAWSVHVRSIVNRLAARGHVIRLVAPGGRAPGVMAQCDPVRAGTLHHLMGSLGAFLRSGRDFRPDLVYVRGIHATITPALAAARLERPLVVEINGLLEGEAKSRWRRAAVKVAHRFTLARASRVVTVATPLKEALCARYAYPGDLIDVVPNGADTELFRPGDRDGARRRLGLPLDRPIVLCVASFYAHHALEMLAPAAKEAGAFLVLVGGEPRRSEDVWAIGPQPHERVPDYVAATDVCAYVLRSPYRGASFSPLKVYEAMAGGRAVACASDLAEVRDFVNESGIGLAVELEAKKLSEVLKKMLADRSSLEGMGRRGRELAESTYSWDRASAQVEESLKKALHDPGRSPRRS